MSAMEESDDAEATSGGDKRDATTAGLAAGDEHGAQAVPSAQSVAAKRHKSQSEWMRNAIEGATAGQAAHTNTVSKVRAALKQVCPKEIDLDGMLVEMEARGAIAITDDGTEILSLCEQLP